ncbi:MAG: hypothetical protein MJA83_10340 [Gammaproteobacteria bacterium]|nr:hypothetical protein [Gammaproteobacteria bacterium]
MDYFEIANFDKYQHYKDRNPPWIKLHRDILENYEFSCLQDASKAHLILIWLLASRLENRLPYDADWIKSKIGANEKIDLDELEKTGFIKKISDVAERKQFDSNPLADDKQLAMPETEGEVEAEADKKIYSQNFLSFWNVYPKKKAKGKAWVAWKKLKPDNSFLKTLIEAVEAQKRERKAKRDRGEFVPEWPFPATWLNGRNWEDEIDSSEKPPEKSREEKQAEAEEFLERRLNDDARNAGVECRHEGETLVAYEARVNDAVYEKKYGVKLEKH